MSPKSRRTSLALATLLLFVGAIWIAGPLWVALVLGMAMAFAGQPLHAVIARRLHGRNAAAAAITTVLGGLTMISAAAVAIFVVAKKLVDSLALLQRRLSQSSLNDFIGAKGVGLLSRAGLSSGAVRERLQAEAGRISGDAAQAVGVVLQKTTGMLLLVVVALLTMYYVLVDWPALASRLEKVLPLDPQDTRALTREFRDVSRDAFVASIAIAMIQGALGATGFAIARVPAAVTWGLLLAITSFLPVVGTALVWAPVGIYLIAVGRTAWGLFDFAWGLVIVMALTDYVIRPRLVGSRGDTHPLLAIVSLVGGVLVVGLPGLIVGPMVMSLFVASLRIYEKLRSSTTH